MTATSPQSQFDLRIPVRRPLLPMKAAMVFLDRSEDDILALVQRGLLQFAFHLERPGRKRFVVVWRESAKEYLTKTGADGVLRTEWIGLDAVIDSFLPDRKSLRAVEIKHLFCCNQGHVANLIADGLLTVDASRPVTIGRAQSPWVTRASVAEFLQQRRML